jgi:hypothetical protein
MRSALLMLLVSSACGDDLVLRPPDAPPRPPDAPWSCAASATCPDGPSCGGACCGAGEHCENNTCMCGDHAACTGGDMCTGAGFAAVPCGSVCCGVTVGCPI